MDVFDTGLNREDRVIGLFAASRSTDTNSGSWTFCETGSVSLSLRMFRRTDSLSKDSALRTEICGWCADDCKPGEGAVLGAGELQ